MPFIEVTCPSCGKTVRCPDGDGFAFCTSCGGKIDLSSKQSAFGAEGKDGFVTITCAHCGSTIKAPVGAQVYFCTICGARSTADSSQPEETGGQSGSQKSDGPSARSPVADFVESVASDGASSDSQGSRGATSVVAGFVEEIQHSSATTPPSGDGNEGESGSQSAPPTKATENTANQYIDFETSVGASVAGIIVSAACNYIALPGWIGIAFSLALIILSYWYAGGAYPSYFSLLPKLRSSSAISFLNCFVGGPVFGLLWNYNIRRGNKGISHVVYLVIYTLYLVTIIASAYFGS